MSLLERVRVDWTGFTGGPGVSTFYFNSANTSMAALKTLFDQMRSKVPNTVTMTIEPTGDIIQVDTGEIVGSWTSAPQDPSIGSVGGSYSAPTGFAMTWLTDIHLSSRRLRGRTFFVPAAGALFDTDGSLNTVAFSEISAAAANFVTATAGNFSIWQRPIPVGQVGGPRIGGHGTVTSSRVTDKAAVLRSRRD